MLLTSLLLIPILGIFFIYSTTSYGGGILALGNTTQHENNRYYKQIALGASIINLIISLILYITFDFSSNQFQFVQEHYDMSYFEIYLGVDGLSIYFVVRPLIDNEPGQLRPITGLMLYKPTNLSRNKRTWGVEHVSKAWKIGKCILSKGKVILNHAPTILLSQDWILTLKTFDTECCFRYVEKQNAHLSPMQLIWETFLRQGAKDKIRDSLLGTGDLLSPVMDTVIVKVTAALWITERSKGDGVIVVPRLGREGSQGSIVGMSRTGVRKLIHSSPLLTTNTLHYSVGSASMSNHLLQCNRYVSSKPLTQIDIYKKAYLALRSNPGNMTPGTDVKTLDGMSIEKLEALMESIKNWKYECKPTKRVYIQKSNGKLRPLGIPSINDKIVQMAIKMIIEPECENKIFHHKSFGFRPNRSLHHALQAVRGMVGITWMIEGDIKGYFDNIDHGKLTSLIKKELNPDRTMMGILQKIFKAGYMEKNQFKHSILGVPQGGIISPILSNLYLTPLDRFVEGLSEKYKEGPVSIPSIEYRKIEARIYTIRRKLGRWDKQGIMVENSRREPVISELQKLKVKLRTMNSKKRVGNRIHYVRYADDWVVGVVGSREFAVEIKRKIQAFLAEILNLELSEEKTKITHLGTEHAKFLGHYIRAATLQQHVATRRRGKVGEHQNIRKSTSKPKIMVPINDLKDKLIQKGFADKGGKPKYLGKFIFLSDLEIVNRYNNVLRGMMTFYNMAENRSRLGELLYILEYSLAHTLAAKHRLSLPKVFEKFGKPIKITQKEKTIKFDKPDNLRAEYLNSKYAVINPLKKTQDADPFSVLNWDIKEVNILDKPCMICGSNTQVEMHHLRHLKDTKDKSTLIKVMSKINRKTIPLCRTCHMEVHKGKYDGMSLKELKETQE